MKICNICKIPKEEDAFRWQHNQCRRCEADKQRQYYKDHPDKRLAKKKYTKEWIVRHPGYFSDWDHSHGRCNPMDQNKNSTQYLGVCVAEELLSRYFKEVKHLAYNNPGYDFICMNGFKIDSKSSCFRTRSRGGKAWCFKIGKNQIADYFACIAFDDRDNLTPIHFWLIPAKDINHLTGIAISNTKYSLNKWSKYEKPLDKVIACCDSMREEST
jgi:hypothetical protein